MIIVSSFTVSCSLLLTDELEDDDDDDDDDDESELELVLVLDKEEKLN